jgi:phosphoenolpyruvate-protein kinase (PTS system EI component)
LIKYCDFFSIGSNDLTQYAVAVDRGNTELLELFDTFNPGILRLIAMTIKAAHAVGKWAGICGEFAADINGALILVGLGIDELSMSASFIPKIKEIIRKVSWVELQKLASRVLDCETSEEVINYINEFKKAYNV